MTDQLERGKVWCKTCGRMEIVNAGSCLKHGWPKCCGHTMTIDHPSTWDSKKPDHTGEEDITERLLSNSMADQFNSNDKLTLQEAADAIDTLTAEHKKLNESIVALRALGEEFGEAVNDQTVRLSEAEETIKSLRSENKRLREMLDAAREGSALDQVPSNRPEVK